MIFAFSGTGNSLLVANRLAEKIGDRMKRITANTSLQFALERYERIVWVFPVYSWGIPPVVKRFIRKVELGDNEGLHHMVCTCGDDTGLTTQMFRKEISKRGMRYGGAWSVEMPNTYVSLPGFDVDTPTVTARKLEAMPERVDLIARAIRHDSKVEDVVTGRFAWVKTRIIYPLFVRFMMSAKPFRNTAACVGCGKCSQKCPMNNISMRDDRPQWGNNCAGCLACYHSCPQHAVIYGHRTRNKGQYFAKSQL